MKQEKCYIFIDEYVQFTKTLQKLKLGDGYHIITIPVGNPPLLFYLQSFQLKSKYACEQSSLSIGSILCIV